MRKQGKKGCIPCLGLPNEAKLRGNGSVEAYTYSVMILVSRFGKKLVAVNTSTLVSDTVGIFLVKMLGNNVSK